MKKELLFILECFNLNYQESSKIKINGLIKNGLDWNLILKKLTASDILQLAFLNISLLNNPAIPQWFLEKLQKSYSYTAIKNLYLCRILTDILSCFSAKNIPALPLKGMFMVDVIYQDIPLRSMKDIDILVNESDLGLIEQVLSQKGYTKIDNDHFTVSYGYRPKNTPLTKRRTLIELHHKVNLPPSLSIPSYFLWSNAGMKNRGGQNILYPSIEDSLIYAALHFFRHFSEAFLYHSLFPSLKSILDIHDIISKNTKEINWDYILEFAKEHKVKHILYLSIFLTKKYFATHIPAKVIRTLKPNLARNTVLSLFLRDYVDLQNMFCDAAIKLEMLFVYCTLLDRPCFVTFIKHLFRPIPEFAREYKLPYPSRRTSVNYFLRPAFWIINLFNPKNVYQRNNSRS